MEFSLNVMEISPYAWIGTSLRILSVICGLLVECFWCSLVTQEFTRSSPFDWFLLEKLNCNLLAWSIYPSSFFGNYTKLNNHCELNSGLDFTMDIHTFSFFLQGDSGGPLVCKNGKHWVQAGITSHGITSHGMTPDVYTRVSAYMPWIKSTAGKADTDDNSELSFEPAKEPPGAMEIKQI